MRQRPGGTRLGDGGSCRVGRCGSLRFPVIISRCWPAPMWRCSPGSFGRALSAPMLAERKPAPSASPLRKPAARIGRGCRDGPVRLPRSRGRACVGTVPVAARRMEIAMTQWETPAEPHFPHEPVGMDHALLDDRAENGRNHGMHVRGVERVISAMMQCLDQPMNNNDMADVACQSPFHFNRVFHRLTGIPPVQFHYALRLQHAKRLLISTDLRITDI